MARMARKRRHREARAPRIEFVDATPERLSKGDAWDMVNPAKIDSGEQAIGLTRRFFKTPRLDRWHRGEVITQRQWWAGDQYRKLYERAQTMPRLVAAYGERTTGGEPDYGMARTAAQARARTEWRNARSTIPFEILGFIDRLLIHDSLPAYGGRKQMHALATIRATLDNLASYFEGR
jgi:hypothetical protein